MKNIKTLLITLISLLSSSALMAAEPLFPELENCPDIETVFVSKAMLMNASKSRNILWEQLNIYNNKDLDNLYIYSSRSAEGIEVADKALNSFLKKNKDMEILMKTKSKKESSTIYAIPLKDTPNRYSTVIIVTQGNSFSMVVLTGKINLNFGAGGDNMLDNERLFDDLLHLNNSDFISNLVNREILDDLNFDTGTLFSESLEFNDPEFNTLPDDFGEKIGENILCIINDKLVSEKTFSKSRKCITKSKKTIANSKKKLSRNKKELAQSKKTLSKMKKELKTALKESAKEAARQAVSYVLYL